MFSNKTKVVSLKVDKTNKSLGPEQYEDSIKACGAVLLEMAGRDGDYAPEEVRMVFKLLIESFEISDEQQVLSLLNDVKNALEDKSGFSSYIDILNQIYSDEQKVEVLMLASKLMEADGEVEKDEERFLKQIASRLKLPEDALD